MFWTENKKANPHLQKSEEKKRKTYYAWEIFAECHKIHKFIKI